MTSGMPELGSKISLISKADIRYEGQLFTVDPQECTIALASVRSFGTEDRETQFPVPAQNQVYDYILFRGSDIKDIRVVNNVPHPQPLNDPAIMQLSVPPTLGAQPYQQHPILGHMGPSAAPYGSFLPMGGLTSNTASGLQSGVVRTGSSSGGSKPNSVLEFIGGGAASRSTTPVSIGSRKSSVDQGTQAGGNQQRESHRRQVKPIQPPRGQPHYRNKSRERDTQNRNIENHDHGHYNQNQGRPQSRGRPQYQHYQNMQGVFQQYNRGGWIQRGVPRGRGRPKTGGFRSGGPPAPGSNKKTLKFDSEYDFEQANTEFEELRSQLSKVKLDEASSSKTEVNGSTCETDKKEDSGNETGAGEAEPDEDHEIFYDKTKSFFDKISCEAVERAKGKMQRTDWRQERKLNSETFGVAATRRGGFRGRGYRGVYRGGYRGGYNKYPQQQRKTNDQQQSNQQNLQDKNGTLDVYRPLTGEEAIAKKQDDSSKLPDSVEDIDDSTKKSAVNDEQDGNNIDESILEITDSDSLGKRLPDLEINPSTDPQACVGQ